MTCRELCEMLLDYCSGGLESEICDCIRAHLADCPPCVAYVETYQITIRLSRNLPQAPLPAHLMQRLEEAVKQVDPDPGL
jgi:anti-sigma factor RsiW